MSIIKFYTICSMQIVLLTNFSLFCIQNKNKPFTIMIDPAGDAKHTGRLIQDTLERGISLQCAESLKVALLSQLQNIRVVLTRVPGETIQPLQNASFANRLDIDLYLSLYFYQESITPPTLTLYYYLENNTDFWHKPINLYFYPVNQAHLKNLHKTKECGQTILSIFQENDIKKIFSPCGLFGIPFKPLYGITAPAIALEIGLKNKQDWQYIINPLVNAIEKIMS